MLKAGKKVTERAIDEIIKDLPASAKSQVKTMHNSKTKAEAKVKELQAKIEELEAENAKLKEKLLAVA